MVLLLSNKYCEERMLILCLCSCRNVLSCSWMRKLDLTGVIYRAKNILDPEKQDCGDVLGL